MKRREFIKSTAALAAASMVGRSSAEGSRAKRASIQQYRPLGKTGLKISDISCGTGQLPSASLILRAIDRGVNYFDTAPDYGEAETYIGEALSNFKGRDSIVIASKFCDPVPYQAGVSHLQLGSTKEQYVASVEGSLKRMKTDYLDVCFVHAIGELEDAEKEQKRLLDPEMLAAADALKKAGKIRFLAVSSHGPHSMEALMMTAVKSGHYDLIMPAFNFMSYPKLPDVIREAHERGVAVVAMKTLAGAKKMELDSGDEAFEHAAFRWVLKHPEVAGLVITMKSAKDLDFYVKASGQKLAARDQQVLDRYAAVHGADYCRTGCGDCESSCPHGLKIASILRYQMYFSGYGDQKRAMEKYAALDRNVSLCATCVGQECSGACPHGVPLKSKLGKAHADLSFLV